MNKDGLKHAIALNLAALVALSWHLISALVVPTAFIAGLWTTSFLPHERDEAGSPEMLAALLLGGGAMALMMLGGLFLFRRPYYCPRACNKTMIKATGFALGIDLVFVFISGPPDRSSLAQDGPYPFVLASSLAILAAFCALILILVKWEDEGPRKHRGGMW